MAVVFLGEGRGKGEGGRGLGMSRRMDGDGNGNGRTIMFQLTWIHPLHAIGECVVCDEVIASPAGVGDDAVCGGECCCAEKR